MTTMTTTDPRTEVPQQGPTAVAPAAVPAAVSVAPESAPAHPTARKMPRMLWPVAAVALVGATVAAVVGFALSYRALATAAEGWGFGHWGSLAFPLGIDGAILGFYAFDLILVWRQMPKPLLRGAAHLMTAVTIGLNVMAAAGAAVGVWTALTEDPGRLISHGAMPVVFVITVEGVRHLISRTARLEAGADAGRLSLADWVLRFPTTWAVYRHAQTWPCDYATARIEIRDRAVYRVWLKHREEIEAGLEDNKVTALDRLPDLLAPYGVSVEEARALPDQMRAKEQKRLDERERDERKRARQVETERREREHADKMAALAAEAEELRQAGELDVLRAQVQGAADVAAIEAGAQSTAAQRAAAEQQRLADAEERAEETARTAHLKRRAAEDELAGTRAAAGAAVEKQRAAEAQRHTAEADAAKKRAAAAAADDEKRAAIAAADAARARAVAAETELRAVELEDEAALTARARAVRRVARLILTEAGGHYTALPLSVIRLRVGVSESTASEYRTEAGELIAGGYTLPQR